MPQHASRAHLLIESVRAIRIQERSTCAADCAADVVSRQVFARWDANPWVWAISVRTVYRREPTKPVYAPGLADCEPTHTEAELIEDIAQACIDWVHDIGECHLCGYEGGDNGETIRAHDEECLVWKLQNLRETTTPSSNTAHVGTHFTRPR
ncbi:MAG: hypothetical protein WC551_07805 [Patescibacteria group bacterium]